MDVTYDLLVNRMLDRMSKDIDKREGSLTYDAVATVAVELINAYVGMDYALNQWFADTSTREYLLKSCAERGIYPQDGTYAICKGEFNKEIELGSRFSLQELSYIVTEHIEGFSYKLMCEQKGSAANTIFGSMLPITPIVNLTKAELTEVLIPARDDESTESLRQRYMASFSQVAYGGNKADYKNKLKSLDGVGGVKVYSAKEWNGGGTVLIVFIDSAYDAPSELLVNTVQTAVDPVTNSGEGIGIAPIGHFVTCIGANEARVDVETRLAYKNGYDFNILKSEIEKVINNYLLELRQIWEGEKQTIVRIAQIESRILAIEGILDISETILNGSERNLIVDDRSIAILGDVSERD